MNYIENKLSIEKIQKSTKLRFNIDIKSILLLNKMKKIIIYSKDKIILINSKIFYTKKKFVQINQLFH